MTSTIHHPPVARSSSALALTLDRVSKSFGKAQRREVLRDVDLHLVPESITAIVGPSGCGKSTLLRLVAGLETPDSGLLSLGGSLIKGIHPRSTVSFQEPRLLPWKTLARNIEIGLESGIPRRKRRERVAELLELVGLSDSAQLRPSQVSGGMAQRAALARALAREPGILLLDEPFGALDALTRLRMQDLLVRIHAAAPHTILLVTHDVEEALFLADTVVVLADLGKGADASVREIIDVPGSRPRDRVDRRLSELRVRLLNRLGVGSQHSTAAAGGAA